MNISGKLTSKPNLEAKIGNFKKANKPAYIKITGEGIYVYLKGVMQAFSIDTSGYTTEYNYVFSESIGDMIINLAHKFKYTQPEEGETSIGIATIFNAALKAIYAVIDNVERIIEQDVDGYLFSILMSI